MLITGSLGYILLVTASPSEGASVNQFIKN